MVRIFAVQNRNNLRPIRRAFGVIINFRGEPDPVTGRKIKDIASIKKCVDNPAVQRPMDATLKIAPDLGRI
jgi:hypothetical protein